LKITLGLLAVALAATPAPALGQAPCSRAFQDSVSVATLRAFARVAAAPPMWDAYSLARHPLLLLADSTYRGHSETPVCAAIWRYNAPLELLELAARPPFATPLYGMIDSDSLGPRAIEGAQDLVVMRRPAPPTVINALRRRGITRVVVFNVPMNFAALGRLGEMLQMAHADPARLQADLAVHEGFHLHSQFPTWLDQSRAYAWPAWDLQPDRAELRERCYAGSPALTAALDAELHALVASFDALMTPDTPPDTAAALLNARRFITLRGARRVLQDTLTVAQGSRRISCGLAEDLMELEEGATQWLGHATTVRADLATMATLRGSYAGSQPERFYQSGPLQLWVLDGLLGDEALRQLTIGIARSTGAEGPSGGVFATFQNQVAHLEGHAP
jgi:hypothetical protein